MTDLNISQLTFQLFEKIQFGLTGKNVTDLFNLPIKIQFRLLKIYFFSLDRGELLTNLWHKGTTQGLFHYVKNRLSCVRDYIPNSKDLCWCNLRE